MLHILLLGNWNIFTFVFPFLLLWHLFHFQSILIGTRIPEEIPYILINQLFQLRSKLTHYVVLDLHLCLDSVSVFSYLFPGLLPSVPQDSLIQKGIKTSYKTTHDRFITYSTKIEGKTRFFRDILRFFVMQVW